MKLVKMTACKTGNIVYVNPDRVASVCRFVDGKTTCIRIDGEDIAVQESPGEVAAAIERQAEPQAVAGELLTAKSAVDMDAIVKAVTRLRSTWKRPDVSTGMASIVGETTGEILRAIGRGKQTGAEVDPDEMREAVEAQRAFHAAPAFATTADADVAVVELAPGQVWEGEEGRATIEQIRNDGLVTLANRPPAGKLYHGALTGGSYPEAEFRAKFPRRVEVDPVALLAEGKRLRFVRDAGALGERVPMAVEVRVGIINGPFINVGYVQRPGSEPYEALFLGEHHRSRQDAASSVLSLLSSLGYRLDGVAGEGGGEVG